MSEQSIKSVRRVFEILELFDKERRPLAAKDIAKRLQYPLTSAHALLKSMHQLGYADFDTPTWSYTPSPDFLGLLEWVRDSLGREPEIIDFAAALNKETKETITLSRRVNTSVRIVYGLETIHAVGVSVKVGTMMPVTLSVTGIASLAGLDSLALESLFEDIRANDAGQAERTDQTLLSEVLYEVRDRGTVARCDVLIQGIGVISVPIRSKNADTTMVIGVVGPSERIIAHEAEHRRTIEKLATRFGIRSVYKIRNPRRA